MSWRTTIRTNTHDQLVTYQAANPTLLRAVYKTRPGASRENPHAYIGDIRQSFEHSGGTVPASGGLRRTEAEVDIIILTDVVDNVESKEEIDTVADALTNQFSNLPHYIFANTVAEPIRLEDTSEEVGTVAYTGVVLTIGRIFIQE